MLWLAGGFTIFQGAVALYLLAGGALGEYAAATRFAAGYTRLGGPWQGPDGPTTEDYLQTLRLSFVYWALARLVLTVPAIVGGGYGALLRHERRVQQLVLFVVLAYAGIATQAKFFWYHYAYMLPFLALLAGWSWDSLLTALRRVHGRVTTAAVGGLLLAVLLVSTPEVLDHGLHQWDDALRYYRHPEQRESFDAQFYGYDASRQAGWYLQQHTRPDEAIYVWGYDPLVYLLTDRPFASRFIYAFPMMSTWAPPAWRQEFLDDMHAHPPIYFITQHNQGGPWITGHSIDPADYVAWFPPLQEWLLANYDLETTIGDFLIYRRRS